MTTETTDHELLRGILDDPIQRIEALLTVPTKDMQIVPFKLTRIQKHFLQQITEWKATGHNGAFRRVTVKPRQVRMSSVIMARNYTDAMLTPNFNCLVMCQDDDTKATFRGRAHHHHEDLRQVGLAPAITRDNDYELEFGDINSRIVFRTSSDSGGRAYTFHRVHMSEIAFYQEGARVLANVLPSLPPGLGEIDAESTSDGPSGIFFTLAQAAEKGEEWALCFYPWWWEADYQTDTEGVDPDNLTQREQYLMAQEGLNLRQIAFRRSTRRLWESLGADAPPVEREFAEDLDSAFTPGSKAVFSTEDIARVKAMTLNPIRKERVLLRANPELWSTDPDLFIWRDPMPGEGYVIGADVAAGGATHDNSAATVLDRNGFQVAGYYGKCTAVEFAQVLYDLATRYNGAYLVPEGWPGEGSITCAFLHEDYHYPNLHYSEQGKMPRPGFITTSTTRQELVKSLFEAVKYSQAWVSDERLYLELRSLIWYTKSTGDRRPMPKLQAGPGQYDDYSVSYGLAHKYLNMARPTRRVSAGTTQQKNWAGF